MLAAAAAAAMHNEGERIRDRELPLITHLLSHNLQLSCVDIGGGYYLYRRIIQF